MRVMTSVIYEEIMANIETFFELFFINHLNHDNDKF
jgi:hypothetical protein